MSDALHTAERYAISTIDFFIDNIEKSFKKSTYKTTGFKLDRETHRGRNTADVLTITNDWNS
jgi:hypothetical protein